MIESYLRALGRSLLATLIGLPAGSLIASAIFTASLSFPGATADPAANSFKETSLMLAFMAVLLGFLPALFCAQLHALLAHLGFANYISAAAIGAIPGLVLLVVSREQAWWVLFVGFGVTVAVCTHFFANRLLALGKRRSPA